MKANEMKIEELRRLALAGRNDANALMDTVRRHAADNLPFEEIADALEGTEWRFLVMGSGSFMQINHVDDLVAEYRDSLSELRKQAEELVVQDMTDTDLSEELSQIRIRTRVAHEARSHELTGLKVRRLLSPFEYPEIDIVEDINATLKQRGFSWNGGDTVTEIWSKEHQRRYDESERMFAERERDRLVDHAAKMAEEAV